MFFFSLRQVWFIDYFVSDLYDAWDGMQLLCFFVVDCKFLHKLICIKNMFLELCSECERGESDRFTLRSSSCDNSAIQIFRSRL